jgi:DNA-binding NarL/FixJ family response regulator
MYSQESEMRMSAIQIVVTEDDRQSCERFGEQLTSSPDLEIVGFVCDRREVVTTVGRLSPDILILDIDLPHIGGLELLPVVRWCSPNTKVIVLSSHAEEAIILESIELGARGYIIKGDGIEMGKAIRAVQRGEIWARRRLVSMVIEELIALTWGRPSLDGDEGTVVSVEC